MDLQLISWQWAARNRAELLEVDPHRCISRMEVASRLASAALERQVTIWRPPERVERQQATAERVREDGLLRRLLLANVAWYREGRRGLEKAACRIKAEALRELRRHRDRQIKLQARAVARWLEKGGEGTLSGAPFDASGPRLRLEIAPRTRRGRGPRPGSKKWWRMQFEAGRRADARGRWRLDKVTAVKRAKGRGRAVSARIRWRGIDHNTGRRWKDSWVAMRLLNGAAKVEARKMLAAAGLSAARAARLPEGSAVTGARRSARLAAPARRVRRIIMDDDEQG